MAEMINLGVNHSTYVTNVVDARQNMPKIEMSALLLLKGGVPFIALLQGYHVLLFCAIICWLIKA